jgi:hypothetical protein
MSRRLGCRLRLPKSSWWPGRKKIRSRPIASMRASLLRPNRLALKKALPSLRDGRFSILKIDPVRDGDGNVIAYQVEIRR